MSDGIRGVPTEQAKSEYEALLQTNRKKQRKIQSHGVSIDENSIAASRNAFALNWLLDNLLLPDARLQLETDWQRFLSTELDKTEEQAKDVVSQRQRAQLLLPGTVPADIRGDLRRPGR